MSVFRQEKKCLTLQNARIHLLPAVLFSFLRIAGNEPLTPLPKLNITLQSKPNTTSHCHAYRGPNRCQKDTLILIVNAQAHPQLIGLAS